MPEGAVQWFDRTSGEARAVDGDRPYLIAVRTTGEVSDADVDYGLSKLSRVIDAIDQPILHASLRLDRAADPARVRPVSARATLDVNGKAVRAHVAADTAGEAVDLLEDRLRHRLSRVAGYRQTRRRRGASSGPGEWRRGDEAANRPAFFPRPAEEREVVRHKSFAPAPCTIDEAVFDMESLDHDFYAFVELGTGSDALITRGEEGYGLHLLHNVGAELESVVPVAVDATPAPRLTPAEARARLDVGGDPRLWFEDAETGRGHVLYRRYDGHYGLLAQADEPN